MDTIADLLSQIKNAYMAQKLEVITGWSKMRESLLMVLASLGFIEEVKVEKNDKKRKILKVKLKYDSKGRPVLTEVKRVSKPGCRIYTTAQKIPYVLGGLGSVIISTSKGIMTGKEAKEKNLGGEIICKIY